MGELDGKVALITGGARGQGRTHAVALARAGADVAIADLHEDVSPVPYSLATEDDLEGTRLLVEAEGARCLALTADVRDSAEVDAATDRVVEELGRLDVLCANAGIWAAAELTEMSDEQWGTVVDTNLTGVFNSLRAAGRHMVAAGNGGRIIATASTAGRSGMANFGNYVAAKWGVIGMVKSAALELAPHRITVNAICPACVRTDMMYGNRALYGVFRPDLDEPQVEDVEEAILGTLHKLPDPWIEPEEISDVVVFLASERGRHVTGTGWDVTAGVSAGWGA